MKIIEMNDIAITKYADGRIIVEPNFLSVPRGPAYLISQEQCDELELQFSGPKPLRPGQTVRFNEDGTEVIHTPLPSSEPETG